MKKKTYLSHNTRSRHTYAFFKARRNDPNWRTEFLRIRSIRRQHFIIYGLLVIVFLLLLFFTFLSANKKGGVLNSGESKTRSSVSKQAGGSVKPKVTESSRKETVKDSTAPQKNSVKNKKRMSSETESSVIGKKVKSFDSSSVRASDSGRVVGKKKKDDTKYFVNQHYLISPTKYDGKDVDEAMDDDEAPQNTVHDNYISGELLGNERIVYKMGIDPSKMIKGSYKIANNQILINGYKIDYTLKKDKPVMKPWNKTYDDGHIITWKMTLVE